MRNGVPNQSACTRDRVAGDPGLGPGQQAVLAEDGVDQRRLAGVRPPDDGDLDRPAGRQRRALALLVDAVVDRLAAVDIDDLGGVGKLRRHRLERAQEVVHADAVLGRERDRLAETELPGLDQTRLRRPALGLVGGEDHPRRALAQQLGERAVDRR